MPWLNASGARYRSGGAENEMKFPRSYRWLCLAFFALAPGAHAQVQVQLKFSRLQYIADEPLIATIAITNRAGRDIDLQNTEGQEWFGFEITRGEGETIGPSQPAENEPLHLGAGQTVTRKINLTPLFPVQDFGVYHVRAHVYFAEFGRYFYSPAKVVEVTTAKPIWKQSVGVPDATPQTGDVRTYSLLTNRFADHSSLYVRVEDETRGTVYATYPLGHIISFDEPHAEIDQRNRLHVPQCVAPRTWSSATIGLDGQLLARETFLETKTRPHFKRTAEGDITIVGGMRDVPAAAKAGQAEIPKLSTRPTRSKSTND